MLLSKFSIFSFLQNEDDSNIDLKAIVPNAQGYYLLADIQRIEKAANKKLDFVKTTLDDISPQLVLIKLDKNREEKIRLNIHECSNELELTKQQINKIGESKLQKENEEKMKLDILRVLLEKFVIVRQQLLETITAFKERQSIKIAEKKENIKRLSEIVETEKSQEQQYKYKQIIYDEEAILNERQKEIQEILYQLQNVVGMIEYIDQKVEEQADMVEQTEQTNRNLEKAKEELIVFKRVRKNECSDVAFCFMMGAIVVVVLMVATA